MKMEKLLATWYGKLLHEENFSLPRLAKPVWPETFPSLSGFKGTIMVQTLVEAVEDIEAVEARSMKHKLALVVTNLETIQESLLHPPTLNERSIQLEIVAGLIHMVKELQA